MALAACKQPLVIEGEGEVDASLINGETLPKKITVGAQVFSGMINLELPLRIRVTKTAQNSLLAEIIRLSEEVENKKIEVTVSDDEKNELLEELK